VERHMANDVAGSSAAATLYAAPPKAIIRG
jgi:hypothetical protein